MFIKIVPIELNNPNVPCRFSVFVREVKSYHISKQVKYPHDPEKEDKNKHTPIRSGVSVENDYFGQRQKFEMYEIFQISMETVDGHRTVHAPFSSIFILNNQGRTIDSYQGSSAIKK